MSAVLLPRPPATGPSPQDLRLAATYLQLQSRDRVAPRRGVRFPARVVAHMSQRVNHVRAHFRAPSTVSGLGVLRCAAI